MLLHIMHSSDIPPSPPVHIDLAYFPGQILAFLKLFPCCKQYLQRLFSLSTLSLPLWHLVFILSLVGDAPPTIVPSTTKPTTGCSNMPGGCWMVGDSITGTIANSVVAADCIPNADLFHGALPHRVPPCPQHHVLSDFAATYCNVCASRPAAWERYWQHQPCCTTSLPFA